MSKFLIVLMLLAPGALAQESDTAHVFAGHATWTKSDFNPPQFSALEALGVERSAEKSALSKCALSGATTCVITATVTDSCNTPGGSANGFSVQCTATAVAKALN